MPDCLVEKYSHTQFLQINVKDDHQQTSTMVVDHKDDR